MKNLLSHAMDASLEPAQPLSADPPHTLEAREVGDCLGRVRLLDVRSGPEFRERHIRGAVNVPLHALSRRKIRELAVEGRPICFVCATGKRADRAIERARAVGLDQVFSLRGGLAAWCKAGLSVEEGPAAFSLERQVRIAAGLLVLLGVGLGVGVNPAWLVLAAFVGAGLTFAGLTNTCGMALLLSRMPWNR